MSIATKDQAGGPTGAVSTARIATYREDEIVIGLPYERLVMAQLDQWAARPRLVTADRDPRLGLGRATLDAAAAVRYLQRTDADLVALARGAAGDEGYTPSDLDVLSRCLRRQFQRTYAGWSPTFAKNRIVGRRVDGYPHVIDGGAVGGSGPLVQPDHVIDGGAAGGSGPVVLPDHVIDGGGVGQGPQPTDKVVVAARAAEPGRAARVGIVDTRLSAHSWLTGGYVASAADMYSPAETAPRPARAGHATFVAGLVLREAPGAVLAHRGELDENAQSDSWSVARAIATLAGDGLDVLNLSLGCATDDGLPPLVLTAALATLGPDTVVVAAAGNHGLSPDGTLPVPSWPGALDGVVCVGALNGDRPADFSPPVPWVDVYAQGVGVASTCDLGPGQPTGRFGRWNGTSFAAAIVSGAIARGVGPGRSARAAWEELRDKSDPLDGDGRPVIASTAPSDWPRDRPDSEA